VLDATYAILSRTLSFEGWMKYQGFDPAAVTHEELKELQGIFDEVMERRKTSPKLGLMKLERCLGEQKYAVAIQNGSDLWLTFWVRCTRKGEIFLMYPRPGGREWDAHASYHIDGTFHQKSHGRVVGVPQKRQPLTRVFRESEHLGTYGGHGTSTGAVCDPKAFDGVVMVKPGILGPEQGSVGVDLVEPGYEAEWKQGPGQRFYVSGIHQREVFPRNGRPSVAITIQR
jgi:hypothetical protein